MACWPLLAALLALVALPLRADDAVFSVPLTVPRPTAGSSLDELRRGVERGDPVAPTQLADLLRRLKQVRNGAAPESPAE